MLLKSIQSQFKTIQPQLKQGRKEKKKQVSPKCCFFLQMLIPNYNCKMQGPARGYPFVDLFFGFWKRQQLLWRIFFFEFVFFSCASGGRSLLVRSWFSGSILNLIILGFFLKIICRFCKCSTIIADALNFSNWTSIRANWVLVLAEKSDSGK